MHTRILVWDFPTRLFHWLLVACFTGAFLTAESERLRDIHVVCGYLLFGLLCFRLLWGVVGSRHARFASFVRGPTKVMEYLKSLLRGQPQHHAGHNPAGALAIVLLIGLGLATAMTGWMTFNDTGEFFEELHEGLANTLLAVVALHVLGVIVSSRLHRENLVGAMISGYKRGVAEDGISRAYGMVAWLLLAAVLGLGWGLAQGRLPALYDPGVAAVGRQGHEGQAGYDKIPAGRHRGDDD